MNQKLEEMGEFCFGSEQLSDKMKERTVKMINGPFFFDRWRKPTTYNDSNLLNVKRVTAHFSHP